MTPLQPVRSCFYADTQLALQVQQEWSQVVCSNKEAQKRLTKSNGTPEMDLQHMGARRRRGFSRHMVTNTGRIIFYFFQLAAAASQPKSRLATGANTGRINFLFSRLPAAASLPKSRLVTVPSQGSVASWYMAGWTCVCRKWGKKKENLERLAASRQILAKSHENSTCGRRKSKSEKNIDQKKRQNKITCIFLNDKTYCFGVMYFHRMCMLIVF